MFQMVITKVRDCVGGQVRHCTCRQKTKKPAVYSQYYRLAGAWARRHVASAVRLCPPLRSQPPQGGHGISITMESFLWDTLYIGIILSILFNSIWKAPFSEMLKLFHFTYQEVEQSGNIFKLRNWT